MRGVVLGTIALLLAVFFAAPAPAQAAQRTRTRYIRQDDRQDRCYSLQDIMSNPKEFLEREVMFYARYATTSNLFKNVNTRFNVNQHVNFAVWPDKSVLWEEKGRKNVLPTLYVAKNEPEVMDVIRCLNKYELVAITGYVLNVYAGYPWILVTKIERIEKPSDKLCPQVIEHMQAGYDALKAEAGGAAARNFEQALQFGLPCEYRAKAYEQLAYAYLLEDKLDRARGYLRMAVEVDKADPILHLALADVALRMCDPGEAIAHATFALERTACFPQAYGIMGEAMAMLGNYAEAFDNLNTAAGTPGITAREKAMVNVRRARIYARSGREPDAARMYVSVSEPGEALAADPKIHNEIGLFYERLYLQTDDPRYLDSAVAAFEEAARLGKVLPNFYYNAAEAEFRRQNLTARDFTKVAQLIEKIYHIEPDYAPARILEGRMLYAEGHIEEAEFRYQSVAGQIGYDATALLALSEAYNDLGRQGDAGMAVARARRLEPWNARVQCLGQFLEQGGPVMAASGRGPHLNDLPISKRTAEAAAAQEKSRAAANPAPAQAAEAAVPAPEAEFSGERYEAEVDAAREALREEAEVERELRRESRELIQPDSGVSPKKPSGSEVKEILKDSKEVLKNGAAAVYGAVELSVAVPAAVPAAVVAAEAEAGAVAAATDEAVEYGEWKTLSDWEPYEVAEESAAPAKIPAAVTQPVRSAPAEPNKYRAPLKQEQLSAMPVEELGPQEIQTIAIPELPGDLKMPALPITRVELPDNYGASSTWTENFTEEYKNPVKREESVAVEDTALPILEKGVLNLRHNPAGVDMLHRAASSLEEADGGEIEAEAKADFDANFDMNFGSDYEWDGAKPGACLPESGRAKRPAGAISGAQGAYAMIILPDEEETSPRGPDVVKIPPVFSFSPDTSPVILSNVTGGGEEREVATRRFRWFRRHGEKVRPAEITEREGVNPRLTLHSDTVVMAPPGDGSKPRAEVRLPSYSRGVGMASDYLPAR